MATDEAKRDFINKNVDADLMFVWEDTGVTLDLQFRIAQHYRNLKKFTAVADSRVELRAACAADWGCDPAASADNKSAVASVICAWESSKDLVEKENSLRAEAKVLGIPRSLSTSDKVAMRRAVEAAFGRFDDGECPSSDYITSKLEELELNEPTAAPLDEVTSVEEALVVGMQSSLDTSGHVRVTKTKSKGSLPRSTEELRMKHKIESNVWLMMSSKFKNRSWLKDLTPGCWSKFTDFILGKKVNEIEVPCLNSSSNIMVPLRPHWVVVLNYEYALRKAAFKRVRDGSSTTLSAALKEVVRDPELKEIHFTSPLALGVGFAAPATEVDDSAKRRKLADGGKGSAAKGAKGKGKGKAAGHKAKKGKGKGGKPTLLSNTPDGRAICFNYNNKGCAGNCGMVHVCRIPGCLAEHPMSQHSAVAPL
jgi:hypothetical protein